jgi:hypothetical protein
MPVRPKLRPVINLVIFLCRTTFRKGKFLSKIIEKLSELFVQFRFLKHRPCCDQVDFLPGMPFLEDDYSL